MYQNNIAIFGKMNIHLPAITLGSHLATRLLTHSHFFLGPFTQNLMGYFPASENSGNPQTTKIPIKDISYTYIYIQYIIYIYIQYANGSQLAASQTPAQTLSGKRFSPDKWSKRSPMEVTAEKHQNRKGCPHPRDRASSLTDMAQAMPSHHNT